MAVLTVVSYNVYGARHRARLREAVVALAPDVLVVNETPKIPLVWRWQCNRLARSWGMRRAGGGRDAGSNMICVSQRVQVVATGARRLPQPRLKPRRGIVTAQCAVDGVQFAVVGVHLSLLDWSRPFEATEAVSDAAKLKGPLVLAGDLNERPGKPAWRVFHRAGLLDFADPSAFTSPVHAPTKRIDGLLVRNVRVLEHVVPQLPDGLLAEASDHLPVLARIVIGGAV
ncbi:MAG: endonuclease/exonuclease/phosphatase family protein [Nocardioidaceae bacterium]